MQPTKTLRFLLVISGLIAMGIGASILFAPAQFHASHGLELGTDANLLSEVRAPGGALLVLGFLIEIGVFVKSFTLASISIAAAVYLAYGASRLVSIGFDGLPDAGLVTATAIELVIGLACAVSLVRSTKRVGGAGGSAECTARLGRVGARPRRGDRVPTAPDPGGQVRHRGR